MRWLLVVSLCGCTALSRNNTGAPTAPTQSIILDHLGVAFELPEGWLAQDTLQDSATVFVGPGPASFTTLTFQASVGSGDLPSVLHDGYAETPSLGTITFDDIAPVIVGEHFGLSYCVAFTVSEQAFMRRGVMVRNGHQVLDMTYTAPTNDFAANVEVFELALASLVLESPGGARDL